MTLSGLASCRAFVSVRQPVQELRARTQCRTRRWAGGCCAAIRMRGRIASPENVTESSTRCLTTPAPVASALVGSGSNFPLPLSHACLLWWNLWSCGRRVERTRLLREPPATMQPAYLGSFVEMGPAPRWLAGAWRQLYHRRHWRPKRFNHGLRRVLNSGDYPGLRVRDLGDAEHLNVLRNKKQQRAHGLPDPCRIADYSCPFPRWKLIKPET